MPAGHCTDLEILLRENDKVLHILESVIQNKFRIMVQNIISIVIIAGSITVYDQLSVTPLKHLAASVRAKGRIIIHIQQCFDQRIAFPCSYD